MGSGKKRGNRIPQNYGTTTKRCNIYVRMLREKRTERIFEATVTKNFPQVNIIENFPLINVRY